MFILSQTLHKNVLRQHQHYQHCLHVCYLHPRQSRGSGFIAGCPFVCFSARYLKTDAARIIKLDIEMFHDDSWKPFILGQMVKGHWSWVSKTLPVWAFALLWVLASSSFYCARIAQETYRVRAVITL